MSLPDKPMLVPSYGGLDSTKINKIGLLVYAVEVKVMCSKTDKVYSPLKKWTLEEREKAIFCGTDQFGKMCKAYSYFKQVHGKMNPNNIPKEHTYTHFRKAKDLVRLYIGQS